MKKIRKQMIVGMMVLALGIGGMRISVGAKETKPTSGTCGAHLKWNYDVKTRTLKITGKGKMQVRTIPWRKLKIKKVIIGKNVKKLTSNAIERRGVKKMDVIIYGNTTKFAAGSIWGVSTVTVYGKCDNLGAVLDGSSRVKVIKAPKNDNVLIQDGMVLSKNGKKFIYYFGKQDTLKIPDSVEAIQTGAICGDGSEMKSIIFGKNLKKLEKQAIYNIKIKSLKINEKLKTIEDQIFNYIKIKKVTLSAKTKVGYQAFSYDTEVNNAKQFQKRKTYIYDAFYEDNREWDDDDNVTPAKTEICYMPIKWLSVKGAKGYEVKVQQGKHVKTVKTSLDYSFIGKKGFFVEGAKVKKPIYVSVRPYSMQKGKKVYGKWSAKKRVENYGEIDIGWYDWLEEIYDKYND